MGLEFESPAGHQKRTPPIRVVFFFAAGDSKDQMQHAGGMLRPPVQTLVVTIQSALPICVMEKLYHNTTNERNNMI